MNTFLLILNPVAFAVCSGIAWKIRRTNKPEALLLVVLAVANIIVFAARISH